MPLHPDITPNDLNCSDELWKIYYRNPSLRRQDLPPIPIYDLYKLHPEQPHASNLTRRQRYQVYKYCADLVNFGPEYFRQFRSQLKELEPEDIERIPLTKSAQTPLKAVDVSPSTVQGNAQAFGSFFKQAGIGNRSHPEIPQYSFSEICSLANISEVCLNLDQSREHHSDTSSLLSMSWGYSI